MGFNVEVDWNRLKKDVLLRLNRAEQAAEFAFENLGEQATAKAKQDGSYTDRTGNLRSSIGYGIYKGDSLVKDGGFTNESGNATQTPDGETGIQQGQAILRDNPPPVKKNTLTLSLIAGMHYGKYVESKGYNVLSATKDFIYKQVKGIVEFVVKEAFK